MADGQGPAEPTREQLARFAAVAMHGAAGVLMHGEIGRIESLFAVHPWFEDEWRCRHAETQEMMSRGR